MQTSCNHRLFKLTELKKDRSKGTAPHKPLLHLVVLDLFESGKLSGGEFRRDGELAFRFNSYWPLGARGHGSRPDVKLPFFHSRSDGFWTPYEEDGREAGAREMARIARLDPGNLLCLGDPDFRAAARRTILLTHFSGNTRASLAALLGIDLGSDLYDFPLPQISPSEVIKDLPNMPIHGPYFKISSERNSPNSRTSDVSSVSFSRSLTVMG